ncbi:MAG: DUF6138 family protein [Oscillospiraceae bacterium]|jgi:hypothetical protein|nr:DUF6138 family protein [Oscillospiraceae bacterium]
MHPESQPVIDAIIAEIERQEAAVRAVWDKEIEWKKGDWLRPGWAYGIHFSWDCIRQNPGYGFAGQNETTCFFEWSGVHISHNAERDCPATLDLKFLTTAIMTEEINPALQAFLQKKVDAEPWGGVYGANFRLTITLHADRDPLPSDPAHMQGMIWEQHSIKTESAARLAKERQMVRGFVAEKTYETADLEEISDSLGHACHLVAEDLYNDFGAEALSAFYETILQRTLARDASDFSDLYAGFAGAAVALLETPEGQTPDEARLHLACWLSMQLLLHGTDKYERQRGQDVLKKAEQLGSKEAKSILKFGTGQIAQEIMLYKDKLVSCTANDITKVIDLKLKEESEDAYRAMILYITRLIQANFPDEYKIKFNSKEKSFIPGLPKTKNQQFWNNAARYPALWPLMKDYVRAILDPYDYYDDAEDEDAVPVGGWAVFALGLASAENDDIVAEFMHQNDSEHSITPSYFVDEWLGKYGLTPQNAATVVTCVLGMNERYGTGKIQGLTDPEALAALVTALQAREAGDCEAEQVAEALWGGEDKLQKAAKKVEGEVKTQLEILAAMCGGDGEPPAGKAPDYASLHLEAVPLAADAQAQAKEAGFNGYSKIAAPGVTVNVWYAENELPAFVWTAPDQTEGFKYGLEILLHTDEIQSLIAAAKQMYGIDDLSDYLCYEMSQHPALEESGTVFLLKSNHFCIVWTTVQEEFQLLLTECGRAIRQLAGG